MLAMRAPLTGTKRKDGRWQITLTLTRPDGAKESKTLYSATQREVQEKARNLIAEHGRLSPAKITVDDLLDHCEAGIWLKHSARTQEQYKWARPRISKRFGKKKVAEIAMPDIYQWVLQLAEDPKLSGRSVQIHRSVLRVALQHAMMMGWRKDNPAAGWVMPVVVKSDTPDILPKDIQRAIESEDMSRFRLFLRVLWESGARPQEASDLRAHMLEKVEGYWWLRIPGTKTEKATRIVPVSAELANDLLETPEPWFPYTRRRWTELWHRAQIRLGWRPKRTKKSRPLPESKLPTIYAIRGARITLWRDMGVTDEVWAALAGHEDVEVTREKYDRVSIQRIASQLGLSHALSKGEKEGGNG